MAYLMAKEFVSVDPKASTDADFFSFFFAETDSSTILVLPPVYEERRRKVERVKTKQNKNLT